MELTYETIDAINGLADLSVSAEEWLMKGEKHWFRDLSLGKVEAAHKWLGDLTAAYRKHMKVIDGNT